MAELEENGGEITPELATKLAINQEELDKKVHAYYYVIKTKEAEIKLLGDEITRLGDVIKVKTNIIKRLKNLVDLAVETFGTIKPKAVNKSLSFFDLSVWQKKTIALEINPEAKIDDERFCIKVFTANIPYSQLNAFNDLIKNFPFLEDGGDLKEDTKIINEKLKNWLIANENYVKQLKDAIKDIEPEIESDKITPLTNEEKEREKELVEKEKRDIKIVLAANIKHNSTVQFK
jgi:hypothetical protein